MKTNQVIVKKLIKAGVKNLHEFGYVYCNEDNILTDEVYIVLFKTMLEDNKGLGVDLEIETILNSLGGK